MRLSTITGSEDYFEHGYMIFPQLLDASELECLRNVCDTLLREPPDDDNGGKSHDIGRGHDRRFLRHRHADFDELSAFVLGAEMKTFLRPFIGGSPFLFNEQFVVKAAHTGTSFGWHQDGGYIPFAHRPYVTIWIALDDTSVDNGAVFLLPRDRDAGDVPVKHWWNDQEKEYVGYDGSDPGKPAEVPAGSVVAFSSLTLHRSSPNVTDRPRRGYVVQYSGEPIIDPETGENRVFATAL